MPPRSRGYTEKVDVPITKKMKEYVRVMADHTGVTDAEVIRSMFPVDMQARIDEIKQLKKRGNDL